MSLSDHGKTWNGNVGCAGINKLFVCFNRKRLEKSKDEKEEGEEETEGFYIFKLPRVC